MEEFFLASLSRIMPYCTPYRDAIISRTPVQCVSYQLYHKLTEDLGEMCKLDWKFTYSAFSDAFDLLNICISALSI